MYKYIGIILKFMKKIILHLLILIVSKHHVKNYLTI